MIFKKVVFFVIVFLQCSYSIFSQVSIEWVSKYNGGFGSDAGLAVCVDDSGFVYTTGTSYGSTMRQELIVLKYSSTGVNEWLRRISGGAQSAAGFDIDVDKQYNVYVGGYGIHKYDKNGNLLWSDIGSGVKSLVLDDPGNVYTTGGGSSSYITRKFDTNGNLIWTKTYQNLDFNEVQDITFDRQGNVIVTGQSSQTSSLYDFVTIKYSNSGNEIWLRRYNGGDNDYARGITSDDSNNVYVTGMSKNSAADILTIKYSPSGDTIWKAVYDGGGADVGYDIQVDSLGFVYVGGLTFSNQYVTLKYDKDGNLMWSRVQASSGFPYLPKLKLDRNRNVYMSFVSFRPGLYSNYAVVKYDNDGIQKWIAEYNNGGSSLNYIYDLAVDNQANVFVTGKSGSSIATVKFIQNPTSISQSNASPQEFKLEQNYPNPFNPVTNLGFGISKLGFVSLKVYDVIGNEIATLVNEKKNPGNYNYQLSTVNYQLSSGIYFYSLSVDGVLIDTKRMILLK